MDCSEDNNNSAIKIKAEAVIWAVQWAEENSLGMSESTEHVTHILHSRVYDQVNVFF